MQKGSSLAWHESAGAEMLVHQGPARRQDRAVRAEAQPEFVTGPNSQTRA